MYGPLVLIVHYAIVKWIWYLIKSWNWSHTENSLEATQNQPFRKKVGGGGGYPLSPLP